MSPLPRIRPLPHAVRTLSASTLRSLAHVATQHVPDVRVKLATNMLEVIPSFFFFVTRYVLFSY